jgi:hypothetical protein
MQDSPNFRGLQVATGQQLLHYREEEQFLSFIYLPAKQIQTKSSVPFPIKRIFDSCFLF